MAAEKTTRPAATAPTAAAPTAAVSKDPCGDTPQGAKAQKIIEAARQVFMAQGYGAASMDAIAREAGVSKATLYAYFSGKEALFGAIIGFECRRRSETLWSPEIEIRDVRADLMAFGLGYTEFMLSARALSIYRVVVAEAPRFPELGRTFYESGPKAVLARLADYLAEATERGLLRVPDPDLAAEQFIGMVRGAAYLRQLLGLEAKPTQREITRIVESAVGVLLGAYGADRGK